MLNDDALARRLHDRDFSRATLHHGDAYEPSSTISRSGTRRARNGRRQVMRVSPERPTPLGNHVRFTSLWRAMLMVRSRLIVFAASLLGLAIVAAPVKAQYNCAVAIELDGKKVMAGQIRDTERPSTKALWDLLKTLSLSGSGKEIADPTAVETMQLKGKVRVAIDGAGHAEVAELNFVRNKYNPSAWVIAPADVTRVIKARQK
jgi:hypothetical protein